MHIIQTMVSDTLNQSLASLGARLRAERLVRNDSQARFSARIGVSVPTLRRLEQGDPSAQIGHWLRAFEVLGRLHEVETLLSAHTSLFAAEREPRYRQRARRAPKPAS